LQEPLAIRQVKLLKLSGKLSNGRNSDAKEPIPFGELTLSSFEKASQERGLVRICQCQQCRMSLTMSRRWFT
jgi:hypothetical protein